MEKETKKRMIVEIDGVEYPAEVTCGAMVRFKEETGKEVNQINGVSDTIVWLWCCVKSACSKEKKEFPYSAVEFADQCTMETLNAWTKAQNSGEESKKKKATTKSKSQSSNS